MDTRYVFRIFEILRLVYVTSFPYFFILKFLTLQFRKDRSRSRDRSETPKRVKKSRKKSKDESKRAKKHRKKSRDKDRRNVQKLEAAADEAAKSDSDEGAVKRPSPDETDSRKRKRDRDSSENSPEKAEADHKVRF